MMNDYIGENTEKKQKRLRNITINGSKYRYSVDRKHVTIWTEDKKQLLVPLNQFDTPECIKPKNVELWIKSNTQSIDKVIYDEEFFKEMKPYNIIYKVDRHQVVCDYDRYGNTIWVPYITCSRIFQNKKMAEKYADLMNKKRTEEELRTNRMLRSDDEKMQNEYVVNDISLF